MSTNISGRYCTYLVREAANYREIWLRKSDKDAGSSVATDHRAVSSVKIIQRIYTRYTVSTLAVAHASLLCYHWLTAHARSNKHQTYRYRAIITVQWRN